MSGPIPISSTAAALHRLRTDVGDIEFGYRAQAWFAHVLKHIGATVVEIRHQGHPDITAVLNGTFARFEIEIASKGDRHHTIKSDDLSAISAVKPGELGYLAVLDMAEPMRWATLEHSRIRGRLGRAPISTLHAVAHRELTKLCNDAFFELVGESIDRLPALTFRLLCDRVLRDNQ